ncbi:MAG: FdtA/QdtA family cupin domain-containing protein [Candidatus Bathyarchaeia archaeon]
MSSLSLPQYEMISSPSNLSKCRIINLPKVSDRRGNLTFIEGNRHIPFEVKRVYYIYDVPGGESRGGHAHKRLQQLMIAASGSFDVILDDGFKRKRFHLNRAYYGLYIPPMIWREMNNFSSGAVCLVLASDLYDEDDYIRDYETFKRTVNNALCNLNHVDLQVVEI